MAAKQIYKEEFNKQALFLTKLGAIDIDLAEFFGVSRQSISVWKEKYPGFIKALNDGKMSADKQVEQSLFRRANGYSHPDEKIFCFEGEIIRADTTKHYPPSEVACFFWLKNRMPEKWRDKPVGDGDNDSDIAEALLILAKQLPA